MNRKSLGLSDVRKSLPALVDDVARTKRTVVITRNGKPVAQLAPYVEAADEQSAYPLRGVPIQIADDFDDALPQPWDALV